MSVGCAPATRSVAEGVVGNALEADMTITTNEYTAIVADARRYLEKLPDWKV
jgi:hypothetical protein